MNVDDETALISFASLLPTNQGIITGISFFFLFFSFLKKGQMLNWPAYDGATSFPQHPTTGQTRRGSSGTDPPRAVPAAVVTVTAAASNWDGTELLSHASFSNRPFSPPTFPPPSPPLFCPLQAFLFSSPSEARVMNNERLARSQECFLSRFLFFRARAEHNEADPRGSSYHRPAFHSFIYSAAKQSDCSPVQLHLPLFFLQMRLGEFSREPNQANYSLSLAMSLSSRLP